MRGGIIIFTCILGAAASACTAAKYQDCYYVSILEKKSLTLETTSDTLHLAFSKDADPAIEAFKQGLSAAATAAQTAAH